MHTCMYIRTCVCACMCAYVCTGMCILYMCMCMSIYMHVYITLCVHTCVHTRVCVFVYAYAPTHMCWWKHSRTVKTNVLGEGELLQGGSRSQWNPMSKWGPPSKTVQQSSSYQETWEQTAGTDRGGNGVGRPLGRRQCADLSPKCFRASVQREASPSAKSEEKEVGEQHSREAGKWAEPTGTVTAGSPHPPHLGVMKWQ